MEIQTTFAWVALAAISMGAAFGAAMPCTAIRTYWKKLSIAWSAVWFAAIGAFLISSPKISEIVISYGGVDVKIAEVEQLKRQLASVNDERDVLASKVAELDAEKSVVRTAVTNAIAAANEAKSDPSEYFKWDGAATELNNALDAWR